MVQTRRFMGGCEPRPYDVEIYFHVVQTERFHGRARVPPVRIENLFFAIQTTKSAAHLAVNRRFSFCFSAASSIGVFFLNFVNDLLRNRFAVLDEENAEHTHQESNRTVIKQRHIGSADHCNKAVNDR